MVSMIYIVFKSAMAGHEANILNTNMSESTAAIAITTVFSILIIVNIVGNSVVCAIIKRNRDMRTPMNYLLLNLAIADIVYATFIIPRVFFKLSFIHHPGGVSGTTLCKLLTGGNFAWIGSASSIVTLVAIAIERYYSVLYPHGNKWKLTKHNLKVIIPGSWLFALVLNLPEFLVTGVEKKESDTSCTSIWPENWMPKTYTMTWLAVVVFSLLPMVVLYSRVVYALWFKRNDDSEHTRQQRGVIRVRKRVTLMVVTVTVIYGICWGTTEVVYALNYVISYNTGPIPVTISYTMVLFNSAVNPFVYALLNQQFREKMKKIICCIDSSASTAHSMPQPLVIELATEATSAQPTQQQNVS